MKWCEETFYKGYIVHPHDQLVNLVGSAYFVIAFLTFMSANSILS